MNHKKPPIGTIVRHKLNGKRWIVVGYDQIREPQSFAAWWRGDPVQWRETGKLLLSDGQQTLQSEQEFGGSRYYTKQTWLPTPILVADQSSFQIDPSPAEGAEGVSSGQVAQVRTIQRLLDVLRTLIAAGEELCSLNAAAAKDGDFTAALDEARVLVRLLKSD